MQLLAFILIYPLLWLISILPHRLFYAFSDFVFFLVYRVVGYRKDVVRNNLELVFPNKSELEINRIQKEFYKHIEKLIEKTGNITNIQNTQNIKLNNYGNEDLSHISDSLKTDLLKLPYGMIPKMIEEVHFSDDKPENKNIELTNSRDNKLKVFTGDKWVYRNKDETINDLMDGKYFILDSHYENSCNNFNNISQSRYETFRSFFDEKDKKMYEQLKKECELVLLNNR